MSQAFVESFFPATIEIIKNHTYAHNVYDALFPEDVAALCTEVVVFGSLRNPTLSIHALIGMIIGLHGCFNLRASSRKSSMVWNMAFGFFALMNMAAIPLHCLEQDHNNPLLWMVDCYATGASSLAILIGLWDQTFQMWALWNSLGLFSLSMYVHDSLYLEQWYALPTVLAGIATGIRLLYKRDVSSIAIGGIGVSLVVGGLLGDAFWCRRLGSAYLDVLTAPSLAFAGCNVGFVALWNHLQQTGTSKSIGGKSKAD